MPQPRIPKFSGEGDFTEFHEEAERVLEAYTLPPKIAVELLLRSLEGQARKEVLSLTKEARDDTARSFATCVTSTARNVPGLPSRRSSTNVASNPASL
jgi:hypothetical protein